MRRTFGMRGRYHWPAGEMLLDIDARIEELLPSREEVQKLIKQNLKRGPEASQHPSGKILPEGMSRDHARNSRAISEHPEIVAKIKAQARENEDIPSRMAVLNAIHYEKERKESERRG